MFDYPRDQKVNWPLFLILIVLMFVLLVYFDRAIASEQDEPAAVLAKKYMESIGIEAWKQVAAIRFNFQVEREGSPPRAVKHLWDRKNGRDHVEGSTRDGNHMVVWVNLRTRKDGTAWQDGKKLEGEEKTKALDWAYGRWVNDTYWLIMPFKLLDPGVTLKHEGSSGNTEILHLSFQNVGLTPGDQYWAYMNPETGRMEQWVYLLQGEKEKVTWSWQEWKNYGEVQLSSRKVNANGETAIHFTPLQILDSADPTYFSDEMKLLD